MMIVSVLLFAVTSGPAAVWRAWPPTVPPPEWFVPRVEDDPETVLAMGFPLPLSCADEFSLQLVPGISDKLARSILDARERIQAARGNGEATTKALEHAHGVGPAKARSLATILLLDGPCPSSEPRYESFGIE
jgi:hypothetical protein